MIRVASGGKVAGMSCVIPRRSWPVYGLGRGKVQQVRRRGIERTTVARVDPMMLRTWRPKGGIFVVIYDATAWVANGAQIRVLR